MNKQYVQMINNKSITQMKMISIKDSVISKINSLLAPRVIQIGIGGASSCGKTVLIDAFFAVLDTNDYPQYLPLKFAHKGFIYEVMDGNFGESGFRSFGYLRKQVNNRFHKDNSTVDDGTFNFETYIAELRDPSLSERFLRRKRFILLRNLPGEMFGQYFAPDKIGKDSIDTVFVDFIRKKSSSFRKTYKHFFDHSAYGLNSSKKAEELRNEFAEFLEKKGISGTNIPSYMNNFYAYLFYKTSKINIKCIKSTDRTSQDDEINNSMKEYGRKLGKGERDYFCITQIDRIINNKGNLKLDESNPFYSYVTTMDDIYNDIDTRSFSIINKAAWKSLGVNLHWNYFSVSVAFNYLENKFLNFENENANNTDSKWGERINCQRTSLGVLELVLKVLKESGKIYLKRELPPIEKNKFLQRIGEK